MDHVAPGSTAHVLGSHGEKLKRKTSDVVFVEQYFHLHYILLHWKLLKSFNEKVT